MALAFHYTVLAVLLIAATAGAQEPGTGKAPPAAHDKKGPVLKAEAKTSTALRCWDSFRRDPRFFDDRNLAQLLDALERRRASKLDQWRSAVGNPDRLSRQFHALTVAPTTPTAAAARLNELLALSYFIYREAGWLREHIVGIGTMIDRIRELERQVLRDLRADDPLRRVLNTDGTVNWQQAISTQRGLAALSRVLPSRSMQPNPNTQGPEEIASIHGFNMAASGTRADMDALADSMNLLQNDVATESILTAMELSTHRNAIAGAPVLIEYNEPKSADERDGLWTRFRTALCSRPDAEDAVEALSNINETLVEYQRRSGRTPGGLPLPLQLRLLENFSPSDLNRISQLASQVHRTDWAESFLRILYQSANPDQMLKSLVAAKGSWREPLERKQTAIRVLNQLSKAGNPHAEENRAALSKMPPERVRFVDSVVQLLAASPAHAPMLRDLRVNEGALPPYGEPPLQSRFRAPTFSDTVFQLPPRPTRPRGEDAAHDWARDVRIQSAELELHTGPQRRQTHSWEDRFRTLGAFLDHFDPLFRIERGRSLSQILCGAEPCPPERRARAATDQDYAPVVRLLWEIASEERHGEPAAPPVIPGTNPGDPINQLARRLTHAETQVRWLEATFAEHAQEIAKAKARGEAQETYVRDLYENLYRGLWRSLQQDITQLQHEYRAAESGSDPRMTQLLAGLAQLYRSSQHLLEGRMSGHFAPAGKAHTNLGWSVDIEYFPTGRPSYKLEGLHESVLVCPLHQDNFYIYRQKSFDPDNPGANGLVVPSRAGWFEFRDRAGGKHEPPRHLSSPYYTSNPHKGNDGYFESEVLKAGRSTDPQKRLEFDWAVALIANYSKKYNPKSAYLAGHDDPYGSFAVPSVEKAVREIYGVKHNANRIIITYPKARPQLRDFATDIQRLIINGKTDEATSKVTQLARSTKSGDRALFSELLTYVSHFPEGSTAKEIIRAQGAPPHIAAHLDDAEIRDLYNRIPPGIASREWMLHDMGVRAGATREDVRRTLAAAVAEVHQELSKTPPIAPAGPKADDQTQWRVTSALISSLTKQYAAPYLDLTDPEAKQNWLRQIPSLSALDDALSANQLQRILAVERTKAFFLMQLGILRRVLAGEATVDAVGSPLRELLGTEPAAHRPRAAALATVVTQLIQILDSVQSSMGMQKGAPLTAEAVTQEADALHRSLKSMGKDNQKIALESLTYSHTEGNDIHWDNFQSVAHKDNDDPKIFSSHLHRWWHSKDTKTGKTNWYPPELSIDQRLSGLSHLSEFMLWRQLHDSKKKQAAPYGGITLSVRAKHRALPNALGDILFAWTTEFPVADPRVPRLFADKKTADIVASVIDSPNGTTILSALARNKQLAEIYATSIDSRLKGWLAAPGNAGKGGTHGQRAIFQALVSGDAGANVPPLPAILRTVGTMGVEQREAVREWAARLLQTHAGDQGALKGKSLDQQVATALQNLPRGGALDLNESRAGLQLLALIINLMDDAGGVPANADIARAEELKMGNARFEPGFLAAHTAWEMEARGGVPLFAPKESLAKLTPAQARYHENQREYLTDLASRGLGIPTAARLRLSNLGHVHHEKLATLRRQLNDILPKQGAQHTAGIYDTLVQEADPAAIEELERRFASDDLAVKVATKQAGTADRAALKKDIREHGAIRQSNEAVLKSLAKQVASQRWLTKVFTGKAKGPMGDGKAAKAEFERDVTQMTDEAAVELERELRQEVASEILAEYHGKLAAKARDRLTKSAPKGNHESQARAEADDTIRALLDLVYRGSLEDADLSEPQKALLRNPEHARFLERWQSAIGARSSNLTKAAFETTLAQKSQEWATKRLNGKNLETLARGIFTTVQAQEKRTHEAGTTPPSIAQLEGLIVSEIEKRTAEGSAERDALMHLFGHYSQVHTDAIQTRARGLVDHLFIRRRLETEDPAKAGVLTWLGVPGGELPFLGAFFSGQMKASGCTQAADDAWSAWEGEKARFEELHRKHLIQSPALVEFERKAAKIRHDNAALEVGRHREYMAAARQKQLSENLIAQIQKAKASPEWRDSTKMPESQKSLMERQLVSLNNDLVRWNQMMKRVSGEYIEFKAQLKRDTEALKNEKTAVYAKAQEQYMAALKSAGVKGDGSREAFLRQQVIDNLQRIGIKSPSDEVVRLELARLNSYFDWRDRAQKLAKALGASPTWDTDPRARELIAEAASGTHGCNLTEASARAFLNQAHAEARTVEGRKQAVLNRLSGWGITWNGGALNFDDLKGNAKGLRWDAAQKKMVASTRLRWDELESTLNEFDDLFGGAKVGPGGVREGAAHMLREAILAKWNGNSRSQYFRWHERNDQTAISVIYHGDGTYGIVFHPMEDLLAAGKKASEDGRKALDSVHAKMKAFTRTSTSFFQMFSSADERAYEQLVSTYQGIQDATKALSALGSTMVPDGNGGEMPAEAMAALLEFQYTNRVIPADYEGAHNILMEKLYKVGTTMAVLGSFALPGSTSLLGTMFTTGRMMAGFTYLNGLQRDEFANLGWTAADPNFTWRSHAAATGKSFVIFAAAGPLGHGLRYVPGVGPLLGRLPGEWGKHVASGIGAAGSTLATNVAFDAVDAWLHDNDFSLGTSLSHALPEAGINAFMMLNIDNAFVGRFRTEWGRFFAAMGANYAYTTAMTTWEWYQMKSQLTTQLDMAKKRLADNPDALDAKGEIENLTKELDELSLKQMMWRAWATDLLSNSFMSRNLAKNGWHASVRRDALRIGTVENGHPVTFDAIVDRVAETVGGDRNEAVQRIAISLMDAPYRYLQPLRDQAKKALDAARASGTHADDAAAARALVETPTLPGVDAPAHDAFRAIAQLATAMRMSPERLLGVLNQRAGQRNFRGDFSPQEEMKQLQDMARTAIEGDLSALTAANGGVDLARLPAGARAQRDSLLAELITLSPENYYRMPADQLDVTNPLHQQILAVAAGHRGLPPDLIVPFLTVYRADPAQPLTWNTLLRDLGRSLPSSPGRQAALVREGRLPLEALELMHGEANAHQVLGHVLRAEAPGLGVADFLGFRAMRESTTGRPHTYADTINVWRNNDTILGIVRDGQPSSISSARAYFPKARLASALTPAIIRRLITNNALNSTAQQNLRDLFEHAHGASPAAVRDAVAGLTPAQAVALLDACGGTSTLAGTTRAWYRDFIAQSLGLTPEQAERGLRGYVRWATSRPGSSPVSWPLSDPRVAPNLSSFMGP